MAGRERSGAASARADLFDARPWVLVATPATSPNALSAVRQLAIDLGALPTQLGAAEHDRAVALISHTPQLVASALAARLEQAPEMALNLAGQGLRDTTRIAASDPRLWAAILNANRSSVSQVLRELRVDIDALIEALEQGRGSVGTVVDVMQRGNLGRDRIPGKHGGAPSRYAEVMVLIPDAPGQLARLFNDVGSAQVNIEDLVIEHSAGQRQGLATLLVAPAAVVGLRQALEQQGWKIVAN
jgi:prephenate dehydrogenase